MSNISKYQELSNQDLIRRNDLGEKCFDEISTEIADLRSLLDEMIEISQRHDLPRGLEVNLDQHVSRFNDFAKRILEYKFDGDNNFQRRNEIVREFREYYSNIFAQKPSQANNFLPIYNAIKSLGFDEISRLQSELERFKNDARATLKRVTDASEALKTEASKISVSDYARIFDDQATSHSVFSMRPKLKVGAAERFFLLGSVSLAILFVLILIPGFLTPADIADLESTIPFYVRRLLILGAVFYVVRFSFRQYMINKHLATLNKHRQNTLNSIRLFIESIADDDTSTRDLLLIEVARAIYEHGSTGFLDSDGRADGGSPSILELTKLVTKQKNEP